jgi:outer membrane immunogenic protein
MKAFVFAGFALGALGVAPAMAADMLVKGPVPALTSAFNWNGFYVGINGGYSRGRSSTDFTITGVPDVSASQNMNGWLGGAQIGYNWQSAAWVVGIETDIQATGQTGTFDFTTPTVCPSPGAFALPCATGTGNVEQKLPWFGTFRGRLGVTPSDRWLLYVTGGLAYGEVLTNATISQATAFSGGPVIATASTSNNPGATSYGWVIGGGAEWAIVGPWTARLEYIFMDFATVSNSFAGPAPFTLVNTSSRITDSIVRIGLNYGLGGTPMITKY